MRENNFLYPVFSACVLWLVACTAMKTSVDRQHVRLSLEKAEKVLPGITTQEEILKLFGSPDKKSSLAELPEYSDNGDIWLYFQEPNTFVSRVSLYFKKTSRIVSSVGWHVNEGEPEQNLEVAEQRCKRKFKNLNFQKREKGWKDRNDSDMEYYQDPKFGIAIIVQRVLKKVSSISWSDPKVFSEMTRKWSKPLSCHHGICISVGEVKKEKRTVSSPEKK